MKSYMHIELAINYMAKLGITLAMKKLAKPSVF